MIKQILATSLVAATLLLSGCGSSDSDGESRLETQKMLDDGDYKGVITKLELNANSNPQYLALAAAYMGKAGYSLLDIVGSIIEDEDSEEDTDMISSLAENATYSSTLDLEKAEMYYKKVVGESRCSEENLSSSEQDMCLFVGLSAVTKVASTINLLVGDISSFGDDKATEDYKLTASTCAMKFAFDNDISATDSADCSIEVNPDVTFSITEKTYTPLKVSVKEDTNATAYYYLMTPVDTLTNTRQTTLTSGYCSSESFTPRVEEYDTSLFACPINEDKDANETTSIDVLIDALNGGVDAVSNAIGADQDDDEIKSSVDEFKCDVLNGTYNDSDNSCSEDLEQNVDEQAVIDYLNNQNGE